jgi:pimeloyl-ACP methyl ester carboxylesterase
MEIILIPGLWLDGSSWDQVVPALTRAGHSVRALTLPGLSAAAADRSAIGLADHVRAVADAIDATSPAAGKVALVGHSAGAAIGYAAVDQRPERVSRLICVGGFPVADGSPIADGFPASNGEVPLPDWSAFDDADLVDLDDTARAAFRARAIPSPARVTSEPQRLSDERRYAVPVTTICTEFRSEMLMGWIETGAPPVQEYTKIREVDFVDLPTGHWPQFTRPEALATAILTSLDGTAAA